jgi:hypothetical protein
MFSTRWKSLWNHSPKLSNSPVVLFVELITSQASGRRK